MKPPFSNVKTLNLSCNALTTDGFPPSFSKLELQSLDLHSNPNLKSIPFFKSQLRTLTTLNIINSPIQIDISDLKDLIATKNPLLTQLPSYVFESFEQWISRLTTSIQDLPAIKTISTFYIGVYAFFLKEALDVLICEEAFKRKKTIISQFVEAYFILNKTTKSFTPSSMTELLSKSFIDKSSSELFFFDKNSLFHISKIDQLPIGLKIIAFYAFIKELDEDSQYLKKLSPQLSNTSKNLSLLHTIDLFLQNELKNIQGYDSNQAASIRTKRQEFLKRYTDTIENSLEHF